MLWLILQTRVEFFWIFDVYFFVELVLWAKLPQNAGYAGKLNDSVTAKMRFFRFSDYEIARDGIIGITLIRFWASLVHESCDFRGLVVANMVLNLLSAIFSTQLWFLKVIWESFRIGFQVC